MAAVDYLLEIDGIKGESLDKKFPGTIEIDSFSWGATNTGAHSTGTGGGAGKVSYQDIHFTTSVNKSSPLLMLACASGQHIKKAVLHVRKQGGDQQEYYTIAMEDLLVSSYQSGGHGSGSSVPTDQFSMNFTKIKFSYKPQKPDGSLDSAVEAGWDVKTNTKL
jgi:type VI secretion system secreted protein Hcp